jgi:hypothetical protein
VIKKVLVPAILAIVVSLAGSAGFTVMKARTMHAEYLIEQDSLAVVAMDSASHADESHEGDAADDGSADHADDGTDHGMDDPQPLSLEEATTPADSIRALIAEREARTGSGSGSAQGNGSDRAPVAAGKSTPKTAASTAAGNAATKPAASGTDAHDDPTAHDTGDAGTAESNAKPPAVTVPKPVAKPVDNGLPERRLAKIFSAMSARDAAKVLGQMTDTDIRTILSMMGDRQAAAVLTALPAERAAAVSRGRIPPMESVMESVTP